MMGSMASGAVFAVDIGSNAIRSLWIDTHGDEHKSRVPLRLGADVFARGRLSQATLRKLDRLFRRFADSARLHGARRVGAVGTSALREAANRRKVIALAREAGLPLKVISGRREALLIHGAVVARHRPRGHWVLLDIGGGSVELVFGKGRNPLRALSLPLGAVRMKAIAKIRKWTAADLAEHIQEKISGILVAWRRASGGRIPLVIATGGSSKALGRVAQRWMGDATVDAGQFEWMAHRLRGMRRGELRRLFGAERNRLDVVVPAVLVIQAVLRKADARILRLSRRGLIDGLAGELMAGRWS